MKNSIEKVVQESTIFGIPGNPDQRATFLFLCALAGIPFQPLISPDRLDSKSAQFFTNERLALLGILRRPSEIPSNVLDPFNRMMAGTTGSDMLVEAGVGKPLFNSQFDTQRPSEYLPSDNRLKQIEFPTPPLWWSGN